MAKLNEYRVAVGFYVHCLIYRQITANSNVSAIETAKAKAAEIMNGTEYPDHVDAEEKWSGHIGYVDRMNMRTGQWDSVAEDIPFDAVCPFPSESDVAILHNPARDHVQQAIEAWPQFDAPPDAPDSVAHVGGADMVEWFAQWREDAKRVLAGLPPAAPVAPSPANSLESAVIDLLRLAKRLHDNIDDPHGDGTAKDSRVPNGDDWSALHVGVAALGRFFPEIGIIGAPPAAADSDAPYSPADFMPLEEARKIKPGETVTVLVDGCGGVFQNNGEELELDFKAGEDVRVAQVDTFAAPQGWAITIVSGNGVVNVFDEGDFGGLYPFKRQ
jgi:hypothetical protein